MTPPQESQPGPKPPAHGCPQHCLSFPASHPQCWAPEPDLPAQPEAHLLVEKHGEHELVGLLRQVGEEQDVIGWILGELWEMRGVL